MVSGLPADALFVAEGGFVGYDFWSRRLDGKRQSVIRVGGDVRLLKYLGVGRERDGIVYLWPDKAAKRNQPPLVLRLVVVHDGKRPWYLVSSVLYEKRPSEALVDPYDRRDKRSRTHTRQNYEPPTMPPPAPR